MSVSLLLEILAEYVLLSKCIGIFIIKFLPNCLLNCIVICICGLCESNFLKFIETYFMVYRINVQNAPCVTENNMYVLFIVC